MYVHTLHMEHRPGQRSQLSGMLKAWSAGTPGALEELTPIVYGELYGIARKRMLAERVGHLLQPSALVNEAFIRLMHGRPQEWRDRVHFFSFVSRMMRQILVDFARAQESERRGNGQWNMDMSVADIAIQPRFHNLIDLDEAMNELALHSPRPARVVELRFFGGLDNPEVAEALDISDDTVTRDWKFARAWLFRRLTAAPAEAVNRGPDKSLARNQDWPR